MDENRKEELLQLIGDQGYATVAYLSRRLYTSPSTIRRNLSEMEKAGYVRRDYGGVELSRSAINTPLNLRLKSNHDQKDRLAAQAARLIRNHSVIFLDASSTCLHMVPHIKAFGDLTIYTNGFEMCAMLSESGLRVHNLGGRLVPRSQAFVGEHAVSAARLIFFDQFFFSSSAFDGEFITDYSEDETCLRRVILAQSREKYFLCDSSKLHKRHTYVLCASNQVTQCLIGNEENASQTNAPGE